MYLLFTNKLKLLVFINLFHVTAHTCPGIICIRLRCISISYDTQTPSSKELLLTL